MKNFLRGTYVLIVISIAITFTQISCQKSVAQSGSSSYILPAATTTTLGGVIPDGTTVRVDINGKISIINSQPGSNQLNKIVFLKYNRQLNKDDGIYTANYDGSNQSKINIVIPNQPNVGIGSPKLSPDGKVLFFTVTTTVNTISSFHIYSCNIDGSNVKKIVDGGVNLYEYDLSGAY